MNCSHITDEMTWSYSRITAYEDCAYRFFLKYIQKKEGIRHFFSDYGSFMHRILQMFFDGELERNELADYYLIHFYREVVCKAPSSQILSNYFKQGLAYLKAFEQEDEVILGVEKEVSFSIQTLPFIGFIDKVSRQNGRVVLTDNKSRNLSFRSGRKKPTKSDEELDRYLRQLYLYCVPIEAEYGELPHELVFNCFRTQQTIREPFNQTAYEEAKRWAVNEVCQIGAETEWSPNIEWFKCRYLCDVCHECEYYKLYGEST